MDVPETRYALLGDDRIAYQVAGEGPMDVVITFGSFSNIDMMWEELSGARFLGRVASFSRLIMFDRRGAGASDPLPLDDPPNWESWVDDLRTVLDTVESKRAAVIGAIDGVMLGIPFAATYPERTSALILINGSPKWTVEDDYPQGLPADTARAIMENIIENWGTEKLAALTYADRADDDGFIKWYAKYLRASSTPRAVRAFADQLLDVDVRGILPAVRVPTLVMHRTGYFVVPVAQGRYMAEHIPNARFIEVPGNGNFQFLNPDEIADHIEEFLTGVRRGPESDRALATVMFTDIVGSTDRAAEVGDRRWREILDAHDRTIRSHLLRFQGRLVNTMGDGILATFDVPGRAIRCARELQQRLAESGVQIRTGVHTGEVELREAGDIGGIAVHIAARIIDQAVPGEVLVSRTVRDLVAGSSIEFEDRGEHALKGVPGEWRLFAVRS